MDARFALLLACFFLSGFAALLYQTVWTRELSFVFGTSELAVAAVLAAYMGGLALGAAVAAPLAPRLRRPVLAYGVLELAIALSALAVPFEIRGLNALYVGLLGGSAGLPEGGAAGTTLFQLAAAFAVLLPPTAFMGATLPLLARHAVRREAEIGSRVGVLYAVNTAGAIAGTLCAAFWLMPELGLRRTVWAGAALNALVFALAALLARGVASLPPLEGARREAAPRGGTAVWILPAILLSGAVSFAYEVLWTRLLGHLLGASLDAFATMLASFLLGIALGSAFAARLATSRERAALGFALAQLGIGLTSYAAFLLADGLPKLSAGLGAGPGRPLPSAGVAIAALLPVTLCIGATFPFAVRLLARSPEQAAGATARVYAWNTVGAIAGALGAGFLLLPGLGFAGTLTAGVATNLGLAAVTAFAVRPRRAPLAVLAVAAGVLVVALPVRPPWVLLSSSPLNEGVPSGEILYSAVGRSCTVLVFEEGPSFRLYSNGLPEAAVDAEGLLHLPRVATYLGALPSILRPETREILVVGLGGGTALERIPPSVTSIDVIELEPEVLASNERMAPRRAIDPLADPRVRVHFGDARGVLQLTEKRYDGIVSQPSHPWTAGASHLYTRDFFERVRQHLEPDGVFVQWIGMAYVDEALLRSLAATLVDVFGHVEVYQPGATMGLIFAASPQPLDTLDGVRAALRADPEGLARLGLHRAEDVVAVRVLDAAGTRALAQDGELNTDDHNRLAARAAHLGDTALDPSAARALWRDLAPKWAAFDGLDRFALIRRLVSAGFPERATDLALALEDEAAEETALGWIELGRARPLRAGRHFRRALELAPGMRDAVEGMVASRLRNLEGAGVSEADLDERARTLLRARELAGAEDWEAIAALDAELARIEPGHAYFDEASRIRVHWRLAGEDPAEGAEAQAIIETVLLREQKPTDALLRARAALLAGRPQDAWGSLVRLRILGRLPGQGAALVKTALEIAEGLPEDLAQDLRERAKPPRPAPQEK